MEEKPLAPQDADETSSIRCPQCDSVVPEGSNRCLMCGTAVMEVSGNEAGGATQPDNGTPAGQGPGKSLSGGLSLTPHFPQPSSKQLNISIMVIVVLLLTGVASIFVLRSQGSQVLLALQPTFTPIAPAPSLTPTWTPQASETPLATETSIPTSTPLPTDTPRSPRFHSVASGETIFGLSLFYRISAASIAEANAIPLESPIQVGQQLNIPWPTATPPLESMVLQIGDEQMVADVTNCEIITIQEGDSTYGLSARYGVPAEAIVAINRLTEESIQLLHPGDTLCMPVMIPGDSLPPTAGPEPTVTATAYPEGPTLLFPTNGAEIVPADGLLRLQWLAVKDLDPDEWYMVELTDLDLIDSMPLRAFTRDSSFTVPSDWRPIVPETHQMRWRVSIVKIAGQRADGEAIYEYGGRSSEDSHFYWLGAVPTPTPTITPSPTPIPD